ncbi:MAG: hypothetical protein DLM61_06275 [Pseudonocardiales bacterium]|nr:MAG: hypothetical protein DLM61_06275 [Pseudonocardiales bacterium]
MEVTVADALQHDDAVRWREELMPDQTATNIDLRNTPDGAVVVTAQSCCAVCHSVTVKRARRVIPSGPKGVPNAPDVPTVPTELTRMAFLCDCGYQHPDRPSGEYGCGRYWQVSLG